MPLKYLIDEHLRGKFAQALSAQALAEGFVLDVLETGESAASSLSTRDDELLRWCQTHGRVLISLDKNTLPGFLEDHLTSGASSPGILLIRRGQSWEEILYYLVLFAVATAPEDCANQCTYIPL